MPLFLSLVLAGVVSRTAGHKLVVHSMISREAWSAAPGLSDSLRHAPRHRAALAAHLADKAAGRGGISLEELDTALDRIDAESLS